MVVMPQIPGLAGLDGLIAAPTDGAALGDGEFVACADAFVVFVVAALGCGAAFMLHAAATINGSRTAAGEGAGASRLAWHQAPST